MELICLWHEAVLSLKGPWESRHSEYFSRVFTHHPLPCCLHSNNPAQESAREGPPNHGLFFVNKALLPQRCTHSLTCYHGCFRDDGGLSDCVTEVNRAEWFRETLRPVKPKIFTKWPFTEKVRQPPVPGEVKLNIPINHFFLSDPYQPYKTEVGIETWPPQLCTPSAASEPLWLFPSFIWRLAVYFKSHPSRVSQVALPLPELLYKVFLEHRHVDSFSHHLAALVQSQKRPSGSTMPQIFTI